MTTRAAERRETSARYHQEEISARYHDALSRKAGSKYELLAALRLNEVACSLHRLDESACNYELTPRQASRRTNLAREAVKIIKAMGATAYIQSDPRGWPIYAMFKGDVPKGLDVDSCYPNGVGVPPF